MNAATSEIETIPKPPLRKRLTSWRWWLFGVVDPRPFANPKPGWSKGMWAGLVVWLLIGVQPWISTWINRHPPAFSELQMLSGDVVYTSRKSPHLGLRIDSGEVIKMEYPTFLTVYGSVAGGTRNLGSYNEKVMGCHASVWFDKPKFTLWERYRVWQIICDDHSSYSLYGEFVHQWSWKFELIFFGVGFFIFLPFIFWMSMRKYWRN